VSQAHLITNDGFEDAFAGWSVSGDVDGVPYSFTVWVKGAAEQTADLIALVQSLSLSPGTENSLRVKLQAAQAALSRGNVNAACGNLKLFIHEVAAQAGKQEITEAQADLLIQEATRIEAVLDCRSFGL